MITDPEEIQISELISREALQSRVEELALRISADLRGEEVTVIGVLKGSFIFLADLVRVLDVPVKVEFIGVSSYEGTKSTGEVRITSDLSRTVAGKNLLLVEDIVDSGRTLDFLLETLKVRGPKSVRICSLLSKPHVHKMKSQVDYSGFEIGDEFVVGYGLDLDGHHRQLPFIGAVTGAAKD